MKTLLLWVTVMAPGPMAAQTTDTLPARVATKQIDTFNRRDIDGFMALYADDAVVTEFPSGKILWSGRAAIREHYAAVFKANTVPPVRVPTRVVDGAFVVDYEEWDGKPGERNHSTWMYEIRGGLIRKVWTVRM